MTAPESGSARCCAEVERPGWRSASWRAASGADRRGELPYTRSFGIDADKAVLIGWPAAVDGEVPASRSEAPAPLAALRRSAEDFGILHRHHSRPDDRDDDLYLRIGLLSPPPAPAARDRACARVREPLAAAPPARFELRSANLRVVSYEDEMLPEATSRAAGLEVVAAASGPG